VDKELKWYRVFDAHHGHGGVERGQMMWAVLMPGGKAIAWCFTENEAQMIVNSLNSLRLDRWPGARQD